MIETKQNITWDESARQTIEGELAQVCAMTTMRFAAMGRIADTHWIACQVDDRIDFGLTPGQELELRMTVCDEVRRTGEMVVIDSVDGNPEWQEHPLPLFYGFKSYVSLPVRRADGSLFGTLCALDVEPRTVSGDAVIAGLRQSASRIAALIG